MFLNFFFFFFFPGEQEQLEENVIHTNGSRYISNKVCVCGTTPSREAEEDIFLWM